MTHTQNKCHNCETLIIEKVYFCLKYKFFITMYCLMNFCCICFYNKEHLQRLSDSDSENITYFNKLTSCVPEMCFNAMNDKRFICNKCCETMNEAYKFRQRCLRSKATLVDYMAQLHQVSNISGTTNVCLTDINKFGDIKKGYQKENITKKNETFIIVSDEENCEINPVIEINRENNPFSIIDSEKIQFENVEIQINQADQFFEENVEESFANALVNQDELITGVIENDAILTNSAIKIENQDFGEHSHKRFDNILETSDNENDMEIDLQENDDYIVYSGKSTDDSLINADKIKIDIVDNDIKLENSGKNNRYESVNILDLPTEDRAISCEDNDETDNDTNFSFTGTSTNKSSKLRDLLTIPENKQFECYICAKQYNTKISLSDHIKAHSVEKPYKCDTCEKRFASSVFFKKHVRTHTVKNVHECKTCQKRFISTSALECHTRIHTGEKPYQCDLCQKKFNQSLNLRRHMRSHTGERPFVCEVCDKRYTALYTLKEHMRIHSGEKPYTCKICQKKFSYAPSFRSHMKTHAGKTHECSICQERFVHLYLLKKHERTHCEKAI